MNPTCHDNYHDYISINNKSNGYCILIFCQMFKSGTQILIIIWWERNNVLALLLFFQASSWETIRVAHRDCFHQDFSPKSWKCSITDDRDKDSLLPPIMSYLTTQSDGEKHSVSTMTNSQRNCESPNSTTKDKMWVLFIYRWHCEDLQRMESIVQNNRVSTNIKYYLLIYMFLVVQQHREEGGGFQVCMSAGIEMMR